MHKKLNIAILGTRGIPNRYGGFEQFAEHLSVELFERGHNVTVYNPTSHSYNKSSFKGVRIINKPCPEEYLGASANFIYDYLCLRDALKRDFDIILECGYGTASASYFLCPIDRSIIITNMDGLEWKRAKWSKPIKKLMKLFEKWGALKSHALVADNKGIQKYLIGEYDTDSTVIPYGANLFCDPDSTVLKSVNVKKDNYFLLIARLEPENNIEMILEGYTNSDSEIPFLVIGDHETQYGKYLKASFSQDSVRFLGSIYNNKIINNLRYYSSAYFHGHSVGGTNPSLLEAMACRAFIFAHENQFNGSVLDENAYYFSNSRDVENHINNIFQYIHQRESNIESNVDSIREKYNWCEICNQYELLFQELITERKGILEEAYEIDTKNI